MQLRREMNGPVARRWQVKLDSGTSEELAREMIPDCVDETLGNLMQAIDAGVLRLSFVASNGNEIDLSDDGKGELAGWYMAGTWLKQHSQERFIDDFEDLDHYFDE